MPLQIDPLRLQGRFELFGEDRIRSPKRPRRAQYREKTGTAARDPLRANGRVG